MILHLTIAPSALPDSRTPLWPVRICAVLVRPDGTEQDSFAVSIRAEGRSIDAAATKEHGITAGQADRTGIFEGTAAAIVCGLKANGKRASDYPGLASCASEIVCWDAELVQSILNRSLERLGEPSGAFLRPRLVWHSLREIARVWASNAQGEPSRSGACLALDLIGPSVPSEGSPDANLRLERAIHAELRKLKAIEGEAA